MKKLKFVGPFLVFTLLAFINIQCGGTGVGTGGEGQEPVTGDPSLSNPNFSPPSQEDFKQVTEFFTEIALEGLPPGSQCFDSCEQIALLSNSIEGPVDCPGGGSGDLRISNCDSNGSITSLISLQNCIDEEGVTGNGDMAVTLTVTPSDLVITSTTDGFELDEFSFTAGVNTRIPCQAGSYGIASCSGGFTSGGVTCTMTPNCSSCFL